MKKATIALLLICTAVFAQQKGTFTDPRDKKKYKTVKIGEQTWFAENLNYNAKGSKCYDDKPANCAKYGRLYEAHSNVCPKGWHVSTSEEWQTLAGLAGGKSDGGSGMNEIAKLMATSGWNNNGNGTDEFGFTALPSGYMNLDVDDNGNTSDSFGGIGDGGYWWIATEEEPEFVYIKGNYMNYNGYHAARLRSIRCVKD